ncbi:MAG: tetratricopeptide repeat protein [Leptolyngbyaceae cyanobacterium SL_7_1]|nr:tetratricopeptide repeat protein [Leptolyngbyaceae cyanobacterium SL_7_1]
MQTKDANRALDDFDRAIALEPKNFTAYFGRGNALAELANPNWQEVLQAYEQVIKLNPDYHAAWIGQGNALARSGQPIEAVQSYVEALQTMERLQIEPTDAIANLREILDQAMR